MLSIVIYTQSTYPDPLPPTIATFFPEGTENDNPFRIFCPGKYSKCTLLNVMADSVGVANNSGASTLFWKKPRAYKKNTICTGTSNDP